MCVCVFILMALQFTLLAKDTRRADAESNEDNQEGSHSHFLETKKSKNGALGASFVVTGPEFS